MLDSAFKNKSLKGLKKLLSAYSSASHIADADDDTGSNRRYHIPSDKVYDALVKACLTKLPRHFRMHLESEKELTTDFNKPIGKEAVFTKSPHWQHLSPLYVSFFKSTVHLLSTAKSSELLVSILQSLENFVQLLLPFPRQSKSLLKSLLTLWSSPADTEDDNVVRLHAFLRIRQLALTQPFPLIEDCLKGSYQSYAKVCKFTNETTLPTIVFMGNCLVELYSLDIDSSYQHAFVYIRQLALHLRAAITKKTKESFSQIYAWQYFNCLRVWAAVISNNSEQNELRDLIYPLVEIILGVVKVRQGSAAKR
jgi:nucleolar complex protein 2